MDAQTVFWIKDILTNDDVSSDEELQEYFVKEGLGPEVAAQWIALRPQYRLEVFCNAEPAGLETEEIVESWEDPDGGTYAIVRYKTPEVASDGKLFEVRAWSKKLSVMVAMGVPAQGIISSFDTLEDAQSYLLSCISEQESNPDIWITLLKANHSRA